MLSESIRESNLRQLQKRYQDQMGGHLIRLYGGIIISTIADRPSILENPEVRRDVLRFYRLVEIGCIASVLPQPLPNEFKDTAQDELRVLANFFPELKEGKSQPMRLLRLLQARIMGDWGYSTGSSDLTVSLYTQFLALNTTIESSLNIQAFLLQGLTNDDTWQYIEEMLIHPESGASLLANDKSDDFLSPQLLGFAEYLELIPKIESVLSATNEYKLLQSGMWHYRSGTLGNNKLIHRLSSWFIYLRPYMSRHGIEGVDTWGLEIENALSSLQSNMTYYERPILQAVQGIS